VLAGNNVSVGSILYFRKSVQCQLNIMALPEQWPKEEVRAVICNLNGRHVSAVDINHNLV